MTDLEKQIQRLMEKHPDLFPTEAKFWQFLRGCLRRGIWEKSPMKFRAKADGVGKPPPNYTGNGKKGRECELTGEWTPVSKAEVDHRKGHISLSKEEDILPYITHLLAEGDQLSYVGKEAHKIKSYAERMNITFDEAVAEKRVIEKSKLPVEKQKKILTSHSLPCHNAEARKESWRKYIEQEL